MKKTTLIQLFLLLVTVFSCKENKTDNILNLDPVRNVCSADLIWLELKLQEENSGPSSSSYISSAKYEGEIVLIFRTCCSLCNYILTVYTCSGEYLGILGNNEDDIDPSLLEDERIIWKPLKFKCLD